MNNASMKFESGIFKTKKSESKMTESKGFDYKRLASILVEGAFYISLFMLVASFLTTKSTGTFVLTLKKAMRRAFEAVVHLDFGAALNERPALEVVNSSLGATVRLLLVGIIIAIAVGLIKGIIDSDKGKNKSSLVGIATTILPVSLPEILVVVILQRIAVLLSNYGIHVSVGGASGGITAYIIPVIAISILPACYIARILSSSLDSKYRTDYIKTAYSKGLNSVEVLLKHALPNALPILLDSLPALSTIFIGNLMVIEYAFSWPGVARAMLYNYGKGDGNTVFAAIIMLALLWLSMYLILTMTAKLYKRSRSK